MRGNIRQRSRGSFELHYDISADGTGKRRQKTETVKGTRKDAERILRERLTAIENGGYVTKHKETVADFMQRWMETYVATNTTLRTQHGYKSYIQRYLIPAIGGVTIQGLTARQIQGIYAGMLERGLSSATVVQLHRILREALSHAVKWGVLTRNVADATTPPRIRRKEPNMWDVADINRFLDAASGTRFHDIYQLAVLTGLRRSELCGLRWANVDLVGAQLSVVNTLQRIPGLGLIDGQPKTTRSRRSIALAPDTVELLHSVRGRQIEQQLEVAELWQHTGYVFTQLDGSPVIPDQVTQDFARIVRRAELPYLTLHGLRHAHATLALMAGVNPKTISERLGHSSIATTMDIYSHVLPGLQEEAALAVERLLNRPATK